MNITEKLSSIKGAEILVVEDNEINQEIAIALLKDGSLMTDIAENGQVAVEKVKSNTYDLVLMDMQMPIMDGLEATRIIREESINKSLPIIALSANAMIEDRERCLAAGMNDHLSKPLDPMDLYDVLLKWIEPKATNQQYIIVGKDEEASDNSDIKDIEAMSFDGLDVTLGMERIMGKRHLYLRLINKFVENNRDFTDNISKSIMEDHLEEAVRYAHTLKGVAGNIGATTLQKAAEKLEVKLKKGIADDEVDALVSVVDDRLKELLNHLYQFGIYDPVEGDHQEGLSEKKEQIGSKEDLHHLLDELKPYIMARKPKGCRKVLGKLTAVSWPEDYRHECASLNHLASSYKFRQALAVIEEIEKRIGGERDESTVRM